VRRLGPRGRYPGAQAGSLLGDLRAIAQRIHSTLVDDDVIVWSGAGHEVYFTHQRTAPELRADCVLGTYRMGASAADIEEDLIEVRRLRVSGSMIG